MEFQPYLDIIVGAEHKSEEQKSTLKTLKCFMKQGKKVLKLFVDHTTIASKAKHRLIHEKD